jgi:hypothetical protein
MSALFQSLQCRFFQPIGYCSSSHLPSSGKAPVKGPPLFWPVLGGYHFFWYPLGPDIKNNSHTCLVLLILFLNYFLDAGSRSQIWIIFSLKTSS